MRKLLRRLLFWIMGTPGLDVRLLDIEAHFITRRAQDGTPIETLADVPFEKRKELKERKAKTSGMNWPMRRAMLEAQEAKINGTVPLKRAE